eukprot:m.217150 g.217150  ORF g.217150 m.217150 type:complete len:52 (+) comp50565_c0_seq1:163-318(+)
MCLAILSLFFVFHFSSSHQQDMPALHSLSVQKNITTILLKILKGLQFPSHN